MVQDGIVTIQDAIEVIEQQRRQQDDNLSHQSIQDIKDRNRKIEKDFSQFTYLFYLDRNGNVINVRNRKDKVEDSCSVIVGRATRNLIAGEVEEACQLNNRIDLKTFMDIASFPLTDRCYIRFGYVRIRLDDSTEFSRGLDFIERWKRDLVILRCTYTDDKVLFNIEPGSEAGKYRMNVRIPVESLAPEFAFQLNANMSGNKPQGIFCYGETDTDIAIASIRLLKTLKNKSSPLEVFFYLSGKDYADHINTFPLFQSESVVGDSLTFGGDIEDLQFYLMGNFKGNNFEGADVNIYFPLSVVGRGTVDRYAQKLGLWKS